MKTIEEKARAYDIIIEKANKMHSENCEACQACIEELIPELAESEEKPNGGIVREDFTQGDGWYKVNLDYLSKAQVEEIEQLVEKWNPKKVSEEEKIKKAILIYLDWLDGKKDYLPKGDYTIKDMILWLERQGEHANFLSKIQVGDKVTRNENGVLVNLSQLKRVAKPSEEQGKQKPVIEFKTAEESLGISSDEYNKIVDECLFGEQKLTEFERGLFDMLTDISKPCTADCVKSHSEKLLSIARKMIALEQKPEENKGNIGGISSNSEWSKEDEIRLNTIINDITVDKSMCKYEVAKSICDEQINWLKSLKDRVQPKQEWSEEDEQHIDSLLKRLDALCRNKFERTRFAISEDRDWLKSIRPQNRWKPSDEQIAQLQIVIDTYGNEGICDPILTELLFQLKKLRGKV